MIPQTQNIIQSDRAIYLPMVAIPLRQKPKKTSRKPHIAHKPKRGIREEISRGGIAIASKVAQDAMDVEEAERRLLDQSDRVRPFKRSR